MKSVVLGVALMVIVAVFAAFSLNSQFSESADERFISPNNVRLGE